MIGHCHCGAAIHDGDPLCLECEKRAAEREGYQLHSACGGEVYRGKSQRCDAKVKPGEVEP